MADSQDAVQVFVVVDNEVIIEIQYYIQAVFERVCIWPFSSKKISAIQKGCHETCWITILIITTFNWLHHAYHTAYLGSLLDLLLMVWKGLFPYQSIAQ